MSLALFWDMPSLYNVHLLNMLIYCWKHVSCTVLGHALSVQCTPLEHAHILLKHVSYTVLGHASYTAMNIPPTQVFGMPPIHRSRTHSLIHSYSA